MQSTGRLPGRGKVINKMSYKVVLAAALSLAIAAPAFAAVTTAATVSPAQTTADHAFGKVSTDGFKAFADIRLARLAIFNGNTAGARSYIQVAAASLQKAKTDDAVFMKAETDLKPPKGITQPNPSNETPSATAVSWLPINGAMTLDEDYAATPAKAAGIAQANSQLKSGDHKHAMETLKLADVNVSFDEEVAPLDKTIDGVDKARQLVKAGQYFEANQALKGVQDSIRFDEEDLSTSPAKTHVKSASVEADTNSKTVSVGK